MELEARTATLWPIIAELGMVTGQASDPLAKMRVALSHLAKACNASVELWCTSDDEPGATPSDLRLLANERPETGGVAQLFTVAPHAIIHDVVRSRQTLTLSVPEPAIAIPLLTWQRLQGILLLRAIAHDTDLLSWRAALEQFAPIVANLLVVFAAEAQSMSTVQASKIGGVIEQEVLRRQIERELARARRSRQSCAVLIAGLDQFDQLKQAIGCQLRSALVDRVGEALRSGCRDSDLLGRYGPNSFLLLLPDSDSQGATFVARRYLEHFYARPITLPGQEPIYLDLSIGLALFPVDGLTPGELIQNAADALAVARQLGGRRVVAA